MSEVYKRLKKEIPTVSINTEKYSTAIRLSTGLSGGILVIDGIATMVIHPESSPQEQALRGLRSVIGFTLLLLAFI